jgi:hypothetical protein
MNELDSQALKAILKKDEPETFKIAENEIDKRILAKLKLNKKSDSNSNLDKQRP